jgi:outer membrane biosynthesis protein TonB
MATSRRPHRLGTLCAVPLVLAACTRADETPPARALDATTVLADHADRLADHLRIGNGCRVLAEAEALLERTAEGVREGHVSRAVAGEVRAVVAEVTSDASCEGEPPTDPGPLEAREHPQPEPEPEPEPEPDPPAPARAETAPPPVPSPAPAAPSPGATSSTTSGSSSAKQAPGQAKKDARPGKASPGRQRGGGG